MFHELLVKCLVMRDGAVSDELSRIKEDAAVQREEATRMYRESREQRQRNEERWRKSSLSFGYLPASVYPEDRPLPCVYRAEKTRDF